MMLRCRKLTQLSRCSIIFKSQFSVQIGFQNVCFEYIHDKPILQDVTFSIREGAKVTIMGQNGSGKSTILKLLDGTLIPMEGNVNTTDHVVATARQVMPRECRQMNILQFFAHTLHGNMSGIESRIASALNTVQLSAPHDRIIQSFSGGQQARLLLASALITDADILLLDEPTNNLDVKGIELLTSIIQDTTKTCVVISHDEQFLNSFTDSVLYLDLFTKHVEYYDGDYDFVKSEITRRIKKENSDNVRLLKAAQAKKDQANVFANKGGNMRKVAKKMRDDAEKLEDQTVVVRREDVGLREFSFPFQPDESIGSEFMEISAVALPGLPLKTLKGGARSLRKGTRLQIRGPNGIGKTTLLEAIANQEADGVKTNPNVKIGYYRQDFNNLNHDDTVMNCLHDSSVGRHSEQEIRSIAASFLLKGEIVKQKICTLSEGQKGLVALTCMVLQSPGLLILDEPTNHINFRHLPAIAAALSQFDGAVILVSHDADFVDQVGVNMEIDLGSAI